MAVYIIAEAGVNHNGSLELAKKLIEVAKKSGADAVKFQTIKAENLVSKYAEKADYQKKSTGSDESQLDMIKKIALPYSDFEKLKEYCDKVEIKFLSTPFDFESIDLLEKMKMDIWKIPSGEITNLPYLRKISKVAKEIIMSTGMAEMHEIKKAIDILKNDEKDSEVEKIYVLHCNTQYPTPMKDVNLKAMDEMRKELGVEIGYSDHTLGIEVPIAAVALGATIIEKHFTLDKNMVGPDHKASLEPEELKQMVKAIRNIEEALGDGKKKVSESERKNIEIVRKSIVAKKNIKSEDVFSENNLTVKRPGTGISPIKWDEVIGKKAKKDFKEDELIEL
ncbi:MAG: N-acetylneuraminate synthase [Fusobacteriaceae bacterium]